MLRKIKYDITSGVIKKNSLSGVGKINVYFVNWPVDNWPTNGRLQSYVILSQYFRNITILIAITVKEVEINQIS